MQRAAHNMGVRPHFILSHLTLRVLADSPVRWLLQPPDEGAAKELLMAFYKAKHPEYANDDKIGRIVQSFHAKAEKGGYKGESDRACFRGRVN